MSIGICTSFFDIGRGGWEGPNLPPYLKRTNEEYFQRFEYMLQLDNIIVVHTENKFRNIFESYQKKHNNLFVIFDNFSWKNVFDNFSSKIEKIFNDPEFIKGIQQPWNPEYWSVDYLMINFLKPYFVNECIYMLKTKYNVECDMYAWIDFGYCRKKEDIVSKHWDYDFNPNKIHFFTTKKHVPLTTNIRDLIETNNVFIMGCHIVASEKNWLKLEYLSKNNIEKLIKMNQIDDDQTVLYMNYIENPDLFEMHYIEDYWFQIFTKFNEEYDD
jgi:protein YibB